MLIQYKEQHTVLSIMDIGSAYSCLADNILVYENIWEWIGHLRLSKILGFCLDCYLMPIGKYTILKHHKIYICWRVFCFILIHIYKYENVFQCSLFRQKRKVTLNITCYAYPCYHYCGRVVSSYIFVSKIIHPRLTSLISHKKVTRGTE